MVLWNNTNLRTKGIIVENIPTITKGKKRKSYPVRKMTIRGSFFAYSI